ncbi:MAG: S-methyl-5-thioribose-1-phosphate isomerase [Planctomycetota bacterium]|jgi:methylthioribose-1-phosphate isomerase|nr:S-methyl-5-thioribose-1-phosphate isomerase [Planctomycetota bacterium]MDP6764025.1 S-methyl-5-thioribose-1-phosphate isomerase [Planctomycetota bacterium]MDP6987993.1 S-methyl-5-thioribose-1-phosphate isomerase [Planctomycetota bacterium]
MVVETIRWVGGRDGHTVLIEQTLLPRENTLLEVRSVEGMVDAIYRLAVRGAPAIGVAAAFGVMIGVQGERGRSGEELLEHLGEVSARLAAARPTAVNLFWALDRMRARAQSEAAAGADGDGIVDALFEEGLAVWSEDRETCRRMGVVGADLIADGATVLTHCNAGALATAGCGTALAPIYEATEQGKRVAVFADETRPLLQGARLTAWELMESGIDVTLITDGTAGRVLAEGRVDAVFVGSDRIARNGDVCNKIGTYSVAILAREHGVPFYVVAPLSTFDRDLTEGAMIPIEERPAEEVARGFGPPTAPEGVKVYNPAFDVTPARLVSAIVTEEGLISEPDRDKVEAVLLAAGATLTDA